MLMLLFSSSLPLKVNPSYLYAGQKQFPPMRDKDRVTVTVDFKDALAEGETLKSATWLIEKVGDAGVNVPEMIYASAVIEGTRVLQLIGGGEPGSAYEPYCVAVTSGFQKLSLPEPGRGVLKVL